MKKTAFTLSTDRGPITIRADYFWYEYCHCVEAHPEEEPIHSALEHCLGGRVANEFVPEKVREMCLSIVAFYKPRAVPGRVRDALLSLRKKYTHEQLIEIHDKAWKEYEQMDILHKMQPTGRPQ